MIPELAEHFFRHEYGKQVAILSCRFGLQHFQSTEGYLSGRATHGVRQELCCEAVRLTRLLVERHSDPIPETAALLALMLFHSARLAGREDSGGGLLLLEEQNREQWDKVQIQEGMEWLLRSTQGQVFSRYHAEASIAAEHCLAPSFGDTRWDRIVETYGILEQITALPVHRLNRAVAMAEFRGAAEGLALLKDFAAPTWLSASYMWSAVMSDLHRRVGDLDLAAGFRQTALANAPTPAIEAALKRRLSC